MIAILGGLGAAAAWAISTVCSSRSSRLIDPTAVVAWVMLIGLAIAAPLAAAHGVPARLDGAPGAWLALSGAGNVVGLLFGYRALRIGAMSLIAPLVSTEGAIAALIAVAAGETLAPAVAVTLAAIAVGVCLASLPAQAERSADERAVHLTTVALAAGAAISFGVSLYATARAAAALPTAWVVLSARLIGAVALALPLALRGRLHIRGRALAFVAASGVCEVLGFYSYTSGARHGIAIAAVLGSQAAALAAVAGFLLFGERLGRAQLAGVVTLLAGVAALGAVRA